MQRNTVKYDKIQEIFTFQAAHPVIGPVFFIFYIFVVFFILLNMFLAIINDTYSEVKSEMELTRVQFEITDLFARSPSLMRNLLALSGTLYVTMRH